MSSRFDFFWEFMTFRKLMNFLSLSDIFLNFLSSGELKLTKEFTMDSDRLTV